MARPSSRGLSAPSLPAWQGLTLPQVFWQGLTLPRFWRFGVFRALGTLPRSHVTTLRSKCMSDFFTIGQIAEHYHEPEWRIRRIVDSLGAEIPRAGLYRLVPRSMLAEIGAKLQLQAPSQPAEAAP